MMTVDLSGKVSLVTGAGRGIGKAIADVYASNGATVIYTDVDLDSARDSASRFPGGEAKKLDVTDARQIEQVIAEVCTQFEHLDILVNNAGVGVLSEECRVTIERFPTKEWNRVVDIDLKGVYQVSKAAAKVMLEQESGRIINIASVVGLVPLRLQCAYAAAKAGVVNLTKAMALELSPRGILVNCIAPGSTLTDATKKLFYGEDGMFVDSVKQLMDHIPLGRPGKPDDIAYAALYLAAPESSYVNGHVLTVDGGWTAGYARDF